MAARTWVLIEVESVGGRQKGRPRLQETTEIDRAIREAAINVLLEHGEAATLNAVAQAAGMSRKTVYARYSNKSELFLDVIRGLLDMARGVEFNSEGSIEEQLFNYFYAALNLISAPPARAIQRLLTVDPIYISALKSEMISATKKHFHAPLRDLLCDAVRRQEVEISDIDATTRILIRLIFADSMSPDQSENLATDASERRNYARFVTQLVTRGMLLRA